MKKCIFGASLFLAAASLFGQATALISGRVVDPGEASVAGATITIINMGTGASRGTQTNGEGLYSVPALTPGQYTVRVELQGFATVEQKNLDLLVGANLAVDFHMTLANVQETVSIDAQAAQVETTQSTQASSIRTTQVQELPMLNRSMSSLMTLMPGAREVPSVTNAHGASANFVSFAGGGGQNVNMLVDGMDNKENHCGGLEIAYSLEGIQEFKVPSSGGGDAEYGMGTVTVLMATKSGTNQFHGTGFFYGRNQDLVRTDYFSDPAHGGLGKSPFSRRQYGGSIGGPILHDRAWFFGSVERVNQTSSLPRSSAQIQQLNYLLPLDIHVLVGGSVPQPQQDLLIQGKVNFNITSNHTAFLRYAGEVGDITNDAINGSVALETYSPSYTDKNHQVLHNPALGETWVISPSMVNQFGAQYDYFTHDNKYPKCPLSIPALGVDSCLGDDVSFPSVSFGHGGSGGAFPDWFNWERKWQVKDDLSWQTGRHSLKFGLMYDYIPLFGGQGCCGSPGTITFFDDPATIVNNTNGKYPQGFQTPGAVQKITETSAANPSYDSNHNWEAAAYAQDSFKITPRLTVNLGLRYDAYNLIGSQGALATNRTYQVLKAIGSPFAAIPHPDWNDWEPRFGLAWDIRGNGKNVVRLSYGKFFEQLTKDNTVSADFVQKPVIGYTAAYVNSAVGVGQLANFIYRVTPLPAIGPITTQYPAGGNSTGAFYAPDLKDGRTEQFHGGWSHLFTGDTVLSVDATYLMAGDGWRTIDINPLINGVRPLSAATAALYGDPNLLGPVNLQASVSHGVYEAIDAHFERRFSATSSLIVNYSLSSSKAMGGSFYSGINSSPPGPQIPSATGGQYNAPWEYGPTGYDERHRVTVVGVFNLPHKIEVSPTMTAATARPYTLYRAVNPSGDGSLQVLNSSGQPIGLNSQRGSPLFMLSSRITRNFTFHERYKLAAFAELYNITDHANFGNVYGGNAFAPATYQKPTGYLGGSAAFSSIPPSFEAQFGGRFSF